MPYIEAKNSSATFEARGDDLEDLRGRAVLLHPARLSQEEAVGLVVNGFVKDVLQQLPMSSRWKRRS